MFHLLFISVLFIQLLDCSHSVHMTEFILNSYFLQRTFVGVDSFKVFQEVYLRTDDPRVVNVVKFSETVGELAVQVTAL